MFKKFVKTLLFTLFFIFLSSNLSAQESEVTTITIENSMQTSYKKSEDGSEDLIELEGAVEISVKKGSNKTSIKADKVTYNRATEMLFASGNVEIVTEGASAGGEKTTANSLLMNTSTLEGVFDGGRVVQTKSDALNLPSGSTLIVFSDLFGKSQSNTISFKNSKLTFCDDEDPHWHIDATRTWLLPGGEFAFFNALLYVGPVPVLYLPAFYYPKDELIFNPVFSKSDRKGFTVQNTYYILGRKPLQSSSSSSSSEETTSSAEALKGLYNFMKPTTLKEQERQGLILHNLDENYSGTTSTYLKVMADYYSKLGYFAGLEGVFQPKNKNITNLKFNVDLGFSKTLFANNNYSFISSANKTYWDQSNFMGLKVPFRYGANLELSLSKPFRTTIQMPLYTDPYFYYDFMVRQESMDWISYFLQGDDTTSSQSEYSTFAWKISNSYSPTLPAALKPYISSLSIKLDSSLSFGTATASFDKSDKDRIKDNIANGDSWSSYTPERKFYYPTEVTPATASVSLSGTIFQWPLSSSTAKKETVKYTVPLVQPEELMSEKQLAQKKEKELEEQKKQQEQAENDGESSEKQAEQSEQAKTEQQENDTESEEKASETEENPENALLKNLLVKLPEFSSSSSSSVTVPTGLSYSLGYSIAPTVTTKFSYGTTESYIVNEATGAESTRTYLNTQEDFDWTKIKSFMYTYKMPTSLSSNLKYGGNYFTMTNKFSWDPILQGHPNTDGVTTSEKKSLILADHKAESQTISNTNTISFKPFSYVPMFADTGVSWNTTLKLFRRDFKGTSSDTNWETYWKSSDAWESYWLHDYWDDENWADEDEEKTFKRKIITTNTVNFTLGANELNNKFKQNFTWSMTLPPQQVKHSLSLNLTFPYVSSSFSWSFQERASSSSTDTEEANKSKYEYNTLSQALSLNLFNSSLKLSESLSLTTDSDKLEKDNRTGMDILDSMKVSLSWKRITAAYTMSYTQNYELEEGQGWIAKTNSEGKNYKEFIPYSLSFSWSPETKTYYKWSKKISFAPGLSTSVIADLIRPTNSYLTFSPSLNFKIGDMLTLSFSATSRNSTLYWYFQGKDSIYSDCGSWFAPQFFGDLFRSFGVAFGDAAKGSFTANREASGFKLKSLSMTASHDLHDWSFNMTWKFEPKLVKQDGQYTYNFDPYISIGIVWKPMDSMKTTIVSEYNKTKEKKVWELNPK
jgi:lipopolysaccharide assembly outer membrane protein LptD (OstA)